MSSIEAFQRFAASCHYSYHGYLDIQEDNFVYQQEQKKPVGTYLSKVADLAIRLFREHPTIDNQEALKIFKASLENKSESFYAGFCCNYFVLIDIIDKLNGVLGDQDILAEGSEEAVFRIRFLSQLPQTLGVAYAPKTQTITRNWLNGESTTVTFKEWETIKWLSNKVYHSQAVAAGDSPKEKWQIYSDIMTGAYKGDALLISDDAEHHGTQELIALGAIERTSSHNEKGKEILGWNKNGNAIFGESLYEKIKTLSDIEHHWSIQGNHVSEILFYAADMRKKKNGKLICAKTARQVQHLIQAKKLKSKDVDLKTEYHYTALQFEYSPDCEGIQYLNWNYWKHKVYSSHLYRERKRKGYEDANVGPYGYGRTDMNPRVIEE